VICETGKIGQNVVVFGSRIKRSGDPMMNQRHKTIVVVIFILMRINFSSAMYDTHTGRFMTQDPIGIQPAANFNPKEQYSDGLNIYEYVRGNSLAGLDPHGKGVIYPEDMFSIDLEYIFGNSPPPDGDWQYGEWKEETPSFKKKIELVKWHAFYQIVTIGGYLGYGQRDAARHLSHFLGNTGGELRMDYWSMLIDSKEARGHFIEDMNNALEKAERLYDGYQGRSIDIVQKGHNYRHQVTTPDNWNNAVSKYHTWGQGKGLEQYSFLGRCCYRMMYTSHFRDNYEWPDDAQPELWELNHYGFGQQFKLRGDIARKVCWKKGVRFEKSDGDLLLSSFGSFDRCSR
jgi:RHS repeat-associated protein